MRHPRHTPQPLRSLQQFGIPRRTLNTLTPPRNPRAPRNLLTHSLGNPTNQTALQQLTLTPPLQLTNPNLPLPIPTRLLLSNQPNRKPIKKTNLITRWLLNPQERVQITMRREDWFRSKRFRRGFKMNLGRTWIVNCCVPLVKPLVPCESYSS